MTVQSSDKIGVIATGPREQRETGRFAQIWQAIKRVLGNSPATILGAVLVAVVVLVAVFGPFLIPYTPDQMTVQDRLQGPSLEHPFGTDQFGRDLLSRIVMGARVSLIVGAGGTLLAMFVGVLLGALAGYWGGWLDEVIMRLIDIVIAFPYIVLAIVLAWVVGSGVPNLIVVIGILRTPQFARITRGSVLSIKEKEFIEAARGIGQPGYKILFKHILPNCISPIIVYASLGIATAISAEASLSFLGLGIQPPQPSWGGILSEGQRFMIDAPWIATIPGIAISLTILGYNLLGDGLRDAFDPRTSGRR